MTGPKDDLRRYLQHGRDAVAWKLDALSEFGIRRPMTPTGTNLLGLVKHLTGCEIGYFGESFGRPMPDPPGWLTSEEPNVDLWATADESRAQIVADYRRACRHADTTIEALDLDAPGRIEPWSTPDVTLHAVLVHMIAETHRHAGHADIVRELVDGEVGMRASARNLPAVDDAWWSRHLARVERAAQEADAPDHG
ncbi:DinB family protein [Rhodococcus sp. HNM0569]|uniref:DinB family protein n=1 Tax=Rhodococcus sp. HNM0569 TaxID=2716340 RepID=UPI00146D798D|nr:DinB family protein [Rhodococcus sp. HNM0569]NLU84218.1 DinB family protein [Rhodococcus sp. HNM0569]